jgi:hypothetical protein
MQIRLTMLLEAGKMQEMMRSSTLEVAGGNWEAPDPRASHGSRMRLIVALTWFLGGPGVSWNVLHVDRLRL